MQQTDSIFALPTDYPAITPFNEAVKYPLLIAAIHDKSFHPQLPPLTDSSWDDVYARNKKSAFYSSALENLGDAILRWILAQVARKSIPTFTAEGTLVSPHYFTLSSLSNQWYPQSLGYVVNSNSVYGNIAQRLRLHKNARGSTDLRLATPGNVDLNPIKRYANLFETMIGAYWVQPGVRYEEVFNWIDVTFRQDPVHAVGRGHDEIQSFTIVVAEHDSARMCQWLCQNVAPRNKPGFKLTPSD